MSGLRIIAGQYKGRILKTLPGANTRPTSDRVREAWASTMTSMLPQGFAGAHVLDAFGGSGALGLEAISRGAATAILCENNPAAQNIIKNNLASLGVGAPQVQLVRSDIFAKRTHKILGEMLSFDAIFLDPPYITAAADIARLLNNIILESVLKDRTLISYERKNTAKNAVECTDKTLDKLVEGLQLVSQNIYSDTKIEYYFYQ
jgi:16S rRNA (guanine966-N2)-methyltransferase